MFYSNTMFSLKVIVFVCCAYAVQSETFKVHLSSKKCRPCGGSRGASTFTNPMCPRPEDVVKGYADYIKDDVHELQQDVSNLNNRMHGQVNGDIRFNPLDIRVLVDVDNWACSRHLIRRGSLVEVELHKMYAAVLLMAGHLDLVPDLILQSDVEFQKSVSRSVTKLDTHIQRLLCKLYDLMTVMGVRRINKKLCKCRRKIDLSLNVERHEYALRIMTHTLEILNKTGDTFDKLAIMAQNCLLTGCAEGSKLQCSDGEAKAGGRRRARGKNEKRNKRKLRRKCMKKCKQLKGQVKRQCKRKCKGGKKDNNKNVNMNKSS